MVVVVIVVVVIVVIVMVICDLTSTNSKKNHGAMQHGESFRSRLVPKSSCLRTPPCSNV